MDVGRVTLRKRVRVLDQKGRDLVELEMDTIEKEWRGALECLMKG